MGKIWDKMKANNLVEKPKPETWIYLIVFLMVFGAVSLFCIFKLDNLMHSDMSAEVILSKLLADENRLLSKNWFYSTEIRIVYSQLIMMPLFKIFTGYRLVKQLSIFIFYIFLIASFTAMGKKLDMKNKWILLGLLLLFTPLSNEYLDMMLIGCFYTSQAICTYFVLSVFLKEKKKESTWWIQGAILLITGVILGMTGVRFLANLYVPLFLAICYMLFSEPLQIKGIRGDADGDNKEGTEKNAVELLKKLLLAFASLAGAGIGFLINKYYLAVHYTFDTTSQVEFAPLSEIPERFLVSLRLMVEFMGYGKVQVVSARGIVNAVKCLFLLFVVGVVIYLFKNRHTLLNRTQRIFLYYFLACFLINWYMLIFTEVLQQYRYWIPVYMLSVLLIGIFFQVYKPVTLFQRPVFSAFVIVVAVSSLYGELWQDVKYNDCAKRYAYVEFLEENEYTFGYATFWNASVTEYLTNGEVKVGNLGGENGNAAPYEWLTPKYYYQEGFHEGKTFLLLARTEEAGMLNGDFTVMPDGRKVYEDEWYAVYEGQGMYLFSE